MPIPHRVLFVFFLLALAGAALAAPPTYYIHGGREVRLDLDETRLLLLLEEGAPLAGFEGEAPLASVAGAKTKGTALGRWRIVEFASPGKNALEMKERIDAVAASPGVAFVSPVFKGPLFGWLTVTPDILARVKPDRRGADIDAVARSLSADLAVPAEPFGGMQGAFRVRPNTKNGFDVLDLANRLAKDPRLSWAEPDLLVTGRSEYIPNDPGFPNLWGIRNTGQFGGVPDMDMDGDEAWDLTTGSASIRILILDTGVQQNHPDLNQLPGRDFTGQPTGGGPGNECDNHGTAVAGCVTAIIDNSIGTVGIAPGCKVLSARIGVATVPCDGTWLGQVSWTVDALDWAEDQGVRVTNNSNSYGGPSSALNDKYASTRAAGMVHFASAGNDGVEGLGYPSSLPTVLSIAALEPDGTKASFSNYGSGLAFSAPGTDVYTTDRVASAGYSSGDYAFVDGTSFSSPYAAGVAALLLSSDPTLPADAVEDILSYTCMDLGSPGFDNTHGWGFVNAKNALLFSGWRDAATGPLAEAGSGAGVAWGDYDGDGDADLYVVNDGSANRLIRNNGSFGFEDVTSGPLGDAGAGAGASWGDYDGDGDLDLYLVNDGANKLLRNNGGSFSDESSGPLGDTGEGRGCAWVDCENDGDLDLYFVNNGANVLLRNDGGGVFADATSGPLADAGDGRGASWGDFDNDGDMDLYLVNGGANVLLRNDGAGVFVDATGGPLGNAGDGRGASWGDFDNDGDLDLYVTNNGANVLLRNDGSGTFADATSGPLGDTGSGTGVGWADADNDGDLDLYVVNDGSANRLLRNDGAGVFAEATPDPLDDAGSGQGTAFADFDGDGLVDIYLAKDGANRLFQNLSEPANSWVRFRVVGVVSNTSSIGARLRVVVGGDAQIREIDGGSGYLSEGSLEVEFGLGSAATIDSVRVTWPSGLEKSFTSLAADTAYVVRELVPPVVTVISPNGGEEWGQGAVREIRWANAGGEAESWFIEYSANAGADWDSVRFEAGAGDGSHSWTVPSTPTDQALVRVTMENGDGAGADASDNFFSILAVPVPTVLSPNGGELWEVGSGQTIAWSNAGDPATAHTVEYSTNSGAAWVALADSLPGDGGGSLPWAVPDVPTQEALVRVVLHNAEGSSIDSSDGVFFIAPPANPSTAFFSVTGLPLGDAGAGRGAAWADFDGDADLDLYVANSDGANCLLENQSGSFVDAGIVSMQDVAASHGTAWADYDNDGDLDLYVANSETANRLFRNDGAGAFVNVAAAPIDDNGKGISIAWADYDADNDVDLYLVNSTGSNRLFRNNGNGTFTDVTTALLASVGTKLGAAWADADNDGDADLYLVRNGANKLFLNNGSGVFSDGTTGPLADAGFGSGPAWGDYDNDGDLDLYITNRGANRLLRNEGGGAFTDATSGPLGDVGDGFGAAWGDHDNDGDLDLYLANDGYNRLFRNDGSGVFVDAANEALLDPGSGQSATWADADADGDLDLYLTNLGENRYFRNDLASGAHWIHVRLEGRISNRAAIGARVRVAAGGLRQIREIASGNGYLAQSSLVAAFGLGAAVLVDTIEVLWPNGTVQVVTALAADQAVTIVEPQALWVDVTTGPLGDAGAAQGVACGDYDGDGDEDIYVANLGGSNVLLRNEGGGVFADATAGPLGDASDGEGAAWADFDDDGDLDLYLVNAGGANKLFRNDGGAFADATAGPLGNAGFGFAGVWGDYDNDGHVDLFVVNAGSANRLLRNNGDGSFSDATPAVMQDAGGYGLSAAWGDYDNDGDLDLYMGKGFEPNRLYRNDGGGVFADVTAGPLGDAGITYGVDWGDYDNDGDLDLYIANDGTANRLLRNDSGVFVDATAGLLGDAESSWGVAWGDCDNDGDLDLFVAQSGANRLFENTGGGVFVDGTEVGLRNASSGAGAAWADFDSDGDLDLYLGNAGGANSLFRNDSSGGNHWLRVSLTGNASNRSGIGARVRVVSGGSAQIREISGGSGFGSQSSLAADFGLGSSATVDSILVFWPSGVVTDTSGLAADQAIVLLESGNGTGAGGSPLPKHFALHANTPNPFNPMTTFRYALPEPGRVRLAVYDVSGRLVKVLRDGNERAGVFSASWNGTDETGRSAGSGVYFVRMEARGFASTRKMLLIR
ncbi:MAG: FG-GAP-like repeat-containing protein [Candidatus Eisenbacteria bacterium]